MLEKELETDSPTLSRVGRMLIYAMAAHKGCKVFSAGVKSAFMQADSIHQDLCQANGRDAPTVGASHGLEAVPDPEGYKSRHSAMFVHLDNGTRRAMGWSQASSI